jgi:hypothetical protein
MAVVTRTHPSPFLLLLVSIAMLLLLGPFLDDVPFAHHLVNALFSITLISAVYSLRRPPWAFKVGLALIIPALALTWLAAVFAARLELGGYLFILLALAFTAVMMVVHTLEETHITLEQIWAALSAYLLFGVAWGIAYFLLESSAPGSLSIAANLDGTLLSTCTYYSFVTLSTLGYGDITPISQQARSLSLVEAVVGQLYLAVLIGKLVGMYGAANVHRSG